MDHAAAAAVLAAAAAPPPRPPRRQARTTRQTQSTSSGLTAPSARPGSAAEPARYAPAAPSLPPWLLKQRDALFREATSFAEESQQSQDTKVRSPDVQMEPHCAPRLIKDPLSSRQTGHRIASSATWISLKLVMTPQIWSLPR